MILESPPAPVRPRIARRTALAGALALAALAASGCGGSGDDAQAAGPSDDQRLAHLAVKGREAAPDISGETLTGKRVSLADSRGKIVVINVWGSWCSPCRAEAPNLQKVYDDTREKGVMFLGINTRDASKDNARRFEEEFGVTYPSLWDPIGKQLLRFKGTISPSAIPSTVVIDRKGRIAARAMKALSEAELRALIDPVLKEG
ncbi:MULTISPECIES: TlpA disulfide reductase family protein [unclassified Streptomyces]|uniref:TlpA family protein disulfide reductase n=1 Tax=unclassified Streptomyces TaxID=2593676 RepID=UPI0033A99002